MNCKKDDLAIIVSGGAYPEYVGRILTCVATVRGDQIDGLPGDTSLHWHTEPVLQADDGESICWADEHLRPIRDNPGNEHWVTELRNKLLVERAVAAITRNREPA